MLKAPSQVPTVIDDFIDRVAYFEGRLACLEEVQSVIVETLSAMGIDDVSLVDLSDPIAVLILQQQIASRAGPAIKALEVRLGELVDAARQQRAALVQERNAIQDGAVH